LALTDPLKQRHSEGKGSPPKTKHLGFFWVWWWVFFGVVFGFWGPGFHPANNVKCKRIGKIARGKTLLSGGREDGSSYKS